jgi:divalent metal cation (Fe/Co/Zn/Cd) transporter
MDLVNIGFIILVIKIAISVIPAVVGFYLIFCNRDQKREIKRIVCRTLFGSGSVFETDAFARFLVLLGLLLIVFSGLFAWFFLISGML